MEHADLHRSFPSESQVPKAKAEECGWSTCLWGSGVERITRFGHVEAWALWQSTQSTRKWQDSLHRDGLTVTIHFNKSARQAKKRITSLRNPNMADFLSDLQGWL